MSHVYIAKSVAVGAAVWVRLDNVKNNVEAGAPGVNDDETQGYEVFSRWLDTSVPTVWECYDPATGAAVWIAVSASGITDLNGETDATQSFDDVDDTNVTLDISSAGGIHTFTIAWAGTLADGRIASAAVWNATTAFVATFGDIVTHDADEFIATITGDDGTTTGLTLTVGGTATDPTLTLGGVLNPIHGGTGLDTSGFVAGQTIIAVGDGTFDGDVPLRTEQGGLGIDSSTATIGQLPTADGAGGFVMGGPAHIRSHWGQVEGNAWSGTVTLNAAVSDKHSITLGGDTTIAISNDRDGQVMLIEIVQGAGGNVVTWPAGTKWSGGTPPTLSTGAGEIDVFNLMRRSSGNYYGFTAGIAFS